MQRSPTGCRHRSMSPRPPWPSTRDWLRSDVLPRATADWKAGPERFEEMVRLRELEANGDEILAVGEELLVSEKAARDALASEIDPTASLSGVADIVKDDHAATFVESLCRVPRGDGSGTRIRG